MQPIQGIHHITAFANDPQANVDFYHNLLGQRLVKTTVNFDDPGTYHFYYGDQTGSPGTILTFFPWVGAHRGQRGTGETSAVAYAILPDSVLFWRSYLAEHDIAVEDKGHRFGERILSFEDPDGLSLELVVTRSVPDVQVWENGPIPAEHVLRGFHGVTLALAEAEGTADLLTQSMGYKLIGQEDNRLRFRGRGDAGPHVDLLVQPSIKRGRMGAGTVHHVAFRAENDAEQMDYLMALRDVGRQVTSVMDRQYFHSIYFREPGGVLFEIATDSPGFLIDEPIETLGTHLKLPSWLEDSRGEIASGLPPFTIKPIQEASRHV